MSGSNRSGNTKAVDRALLLVGIAIAVVLAFGVGWLQAREEYKRQQTPTAYADAAKKDAARTCAGTDPAFVFECVNEKAKTAYQTAHDEQDLSAQQRAASSALVSTVLSFMALVLSGVGVWYVKRTLDATLEAVEDTSEATRAMLKANRLTEERNYLELRPYIALDGENATIVRHPVWDQTINGITYLGFKIKVVIKNFGQTPARNIKWMNSMRARKDAGPFVMPFDDNIRLFDLAPNDTHAMIARYLLDSELFDLVNAGTATVFGNYRITYSGLFNEEHVFQFRLRCNEQAMADGLMTTIPNNYIST